MTERKNIDRLFQEKFKDFEAEPPESAWENTEAELNRKTKRRVVPLWFPMAGIAAALLIGAILYSTIQKEYFVPETGIVNETIPENENETVLPQSTDKTMPDPEAVASTTVDGIDKVPTEAGRGAEENQPGTPTVYSVRKAGPNKSSAAQQASGIKAHSIAQKSGIKAEDTKRVQGLNGLKTNADENAAGVESQVATAINRGESNLKMHPQDSGIETDPRPIKNQQISVAATGTVDNKLDTAAVATVVPNALEELLKENEKEEKIAVTNLNRWQVTSSVAPIYFSSASKGSPIDGAFAQNDKSYEKNISVGVGINYAVNKKLSVRTGVNRFTLGYNTNDVVFFAGLNANNFDNITPSVNGANIEIVSQGEAKDGLMPFEAGISNLNEGSISQRMGYIEVPVEMSYKLVDRRFGVSVIGGLSTLFLNENSVSVVSSGMSASLGKANNLNDVHFSSNIGLGFNYVIWKSLQFNFEPMFKYQINTFNKESGNFKPYFIGLYSGLSFKF